MTLKKKLTALIAMFVLVVVMAIVGVTDMDCIKEKN